EAGAVDDAPAVRGELPLIDAPLPAAQSVAVRPARDGVVHATRPHRAVGEEEPVVGAEVGAVELASRDRFAEPTFTEKVPHPAAAVLPSDEQDDAVNGGGDPLNSPRKYSRSARLVSVGSHPAAHDRERGSIAGILL